MKHINDEIGTMFADTSQYIADCHYNPKSVKYAMEKLKKNVKNVLSNTRVDKNTK